MHVPPLRRPAELEPPPPPGFVPSTSMAPPPRAEVESGGSAKRMKAPAACPQGLMPSAWMVPLITEEVETDGSATRVNTGGRKSERDGAKYDETLSNAVGKPVKSENKDKVWSAVKDVQKQLRFHVSLHRIRQFILNSQTNMGAEGLRVKTKTQQRSSCRKS